jgi:hypothetical protein
VVTQPVSMLIKWMVQTHSNTFQWLNSATSFHTTIHLGLDITIFITIKIRYGHIMSLFSFAFKCSVLVQNTRNCGCVPSLPTIILEKRKNHSDWTHTHMLAIQIFLIQTSVTGHLRFIFLFIYLFIYLLCLFVKYLLLWLIFRSSFL